MGSGNLGSGICSNLISPSSYPHSVEATGLPPLPANGLQSELRSDATAATDAQRHHFRRSSYDEATNSSLGQASYLCSTLLHCTSVRTTPPLIARPSRAFYSPKDFT